MNISAEFEPHLHGTCLAHALTHTADSTVAGSHSTVDRDPGSHSADPDPCSTVDPDPDPVTNDSEDDSSDTRDSEKRIFLFPYGLSSLSRARLRRQLSLRLSAVLVERGIWFDVEGDDLDGRPDHLNGRPDHLNGGPDHLNGGPDHLNGRPVGPGDSLIKEEWLEEDRKPEREVLRSELMAFYKREFGGLVARENFDMARIVQVLEEKQIPLEALFTDIYELNFLRTAIFEGFLPMGVTLNCQIDRHKAALELICLKLHLERSVVDLTTAPAPKIAKKTLRLAKRFNVSVNQDFEQTLEKCQETRYEDGTRKSWIHHGIGILYYYFHKNPVEGSRMISIEVWAAPDPAKSRTPAKPGTPTKSGTPAKPGEPGDPTRQDHRAEPDPSTNPPRHTKRPSPVSSPNAASPNAAMASDDSPNEGTPRLVAGELGIVTGGVYLSLTGFKTVSGTGTLQLNALHVLLSKFGFKIWDLGMDMPYKREMLGATPQDRTTFLRLFRATRSITIRPGLDGFSSNAFELLSSGS